MKDVDYYEVLGVSPTSEDVVIEAARKALMRRHHPDVSQAPDAAARAQAINEAWAVLRDPQRRAAYDAARQFRRPPPPPPKQPPPQPARPAAPRRSARRPRRVWPGLAAAFSGIIGLVLLAQLVRPDGAPRNLTPELNPMVVSGDVAAPVSLTFEGTAPPEPVVMPEERERIPTAGEFADALAGGVRQFVTVQRETGMIGATDYSRRCSAAAARSDDILKVDFCAAFDMAAWQLSEAMAQTAGFPTDDYFTARARTLQRDYDRFDQASASRSSIIRAEALGILGQEIERQMGTSEAEDR